jgi:hypothetical protein
MNEGKLPLPRAQAFVACRQIFESPLSNECVLVAPFSSLGLNFFPISYKLSLYADLCGGHGTYQFALELRNQDLETVWACQYSQPIRQDDPLAPHKVILHDLVLEFPSAGRYDLVLLANGEDVAQLTLQIVLRKG